MGTLENPGEQANLPAKPETEASPQEQRKTRLRAALKAAEGIWKDRTDIAKDGVEYQDQLRTEWR